VSGDVLSSLAALWRDRGVRALVLVTAGLMLWGPHGSVPLLGLVDPSYLGPGSAAPRPVLLIGVPWDDELISFVVGTVVAVLLPALALVLVCREHIGDYGLLPPPPGRRRFALLAMGAIVVGLALPFAISARSSAMHDVYPLYRGFYGQPFSLTEFVAYECAYLLFFVALDSALRGVLLFGLASSPGGAALAIAVETAVQAIWHLGKPLGEAWGAPVWGVLGGYVALRARSVWPIVVSHWILNVWIDALCLHAK
jgi:hypothetical protein